MNHEDAALTLGLALAAGVAVLALARALRVPPLVFYLLAGVALGPLGVGWLQPRILGDALPVLVELCLAIILFEGALTLPLGRGEGMPRPSRRLLLVGMPATALLSGLLAWGLGGISPLPAAAFGALIVVTGPTAVGPLLRTLSMSRRLETLLRHEAIWGDCLGILLSSIVLPFWLAESRPSLALIPYALLEKAGLAALLGIAMGFSLGRWILPRLARLGDPELPGMVSLGTAVLAFTAGQSISAGAGPIASAVAGFTLALMRAPYSREIRLFKGQIAFVLIATLFVLLPALLDGEALRASGLGRLAGTAVLVGVAVRPLAMALAFRRTVLPVPERFFAALIGPRGIIALATASFVVTQRPGDQMALEVFVLTFLCILFSGAFATLGARPLARALRVQTPEASTGILVVGIHGFSRTLALALAPYVDVRLVDSDPAKVAAAKAVGLDAVQADAMKETVYEEAAEEGFRRVLAATPNDLLNLEILERAEPVFGHTRVFRMLSREAGEMLQRRPSLRRQVAFGESVTLDTMAAEGLEILPLDGPQPGAVPLVALPEGGARILRADTKSGESRRCLALVRGSRQPGAEPLAP